jgi:lysophospholipase L1-like esterase
VLALVIASGFVVTPAAARTNDAPPPRTAAASTTEHLRGLQYAALGDSYSAGYGLTPLTGLPVPGCRQADVDFPHLVAADLHLSLTDASCGGAVTANLNATPQLTSDGTAPVQNSSLTADTDIVTVTIGGNDLGFAEIISFCTALTGNGPVAGNLTLTNCRSSFALTSDGDLLAARIINTVEPAVAAALADITVRAPNAKIFVVGYPALFPDAATTPADGCFTSALGNGQPPFPESTFPFTDVDSSYLHSVQTDLDAALARQTELAGGTFVPTLSKSEAHSACAPPGEAYIEGITLIRPLNAASPDPVTPRARPDNSTTLGIEAAPGAMHPNTAGVAFLADEVISAILAAFPAPTETLHASPPPAPTGDNSNLANWAIIGGLAALSGLGVLAMTWRRRSAG